MLDGYIDFFMDPNLADSYIKLKEELNKLLQKKASFFFRLPKRNKCKVQVFNTFSISTMCSLEIRAWIFTKKAST